MSHTLAAWGPWGILLLGFIDSAGVPVAVGMDAMVVLLAVKAPERAWLGAAMAVAGSMAGNLVLFLLARKGGRRFQSHAPQPGKPRKFRAWFDRYGLATVLVPALVPVPLPLKVFVITAGVLRTPLRSFVLVVLVARLARYFGLAWMGLKLGEQSAGFIRQHAWGFAGAAAVVFAGTYGLMRLAERWQEKPGD